MVRDCSEHELQSPRALLTNNALSHKTQPPAMVHLAAPTYAHDALV